MLNIPFTRISEDDFIEVPASVPSIQLPIQTVGISNRPHYISVLDPFMGEPTRLFAQMKLSLNLPANERGLHMSRIERTLHDIEMESPRELGDFAKVLVEKILERQSQKHCRVEIVADYELLVDKNASGRPSHELLKLFIAADFRDGKVSIESGVTVPFMNACPCAQRWGIRDFAKKLENKGYSAEQIQDIIVDAPLQGHTQRGDASLLIHDSVDHKLIYQVLEKSSPLVRELLSGADEGDVVREAQERGMFCEDVAREVMKNTVNDLQNKIEDQVIVKIDVDVDESVHHHNLFTSSELSFGELHALNTHN